MSNGDPVQAAKDAYEAARDAADAVTFDPNASEAEKGKARTARDRMLAAYNDAAMEEAEQRTAMLSSFIAELQTLIDALTSPGIGGAIGTLNEAISTVNTVLQSEQGN